MRGLNLPLPPVSDDTSLLGDLAQQFGRLSAKEKAVWHRRATNAFQDTAPYQIRIPKKYEKLWNVYKTIAPAQYADDNITRKAFLELAKRYSEPHRHHHTLAHIQDLVDQYLYYKERLGDSARTVLCAIFYHDVVYNCAHGQDETESAELASIALASVGVNQRTIKRALALIKATAKHEASPDDFAANLFLDMDMSVLASRPDVYAQYVANTRSEYCQKLEINAATFNVARTQRFLLPVLNGDTPIFKTDEFKHLEPIARRNMQIELGWYGHSTTPEPTMRREP